jgi:hypothetical protein
MFTDMLGFETNSVDALANLTEAGLARLSQRGRPTGTRMKRIVEAARLFQAARRHPLGEVIVREAFGNSDFPLTFGWYTDRQMLARYQSTPAAWQQFLKRTTLSDFRAAARDRIQGGNTPMQKLKPTQDYPNDAQIQGERDTSLQLAKYGRMYPISWEAQVNDVLDQLAEMPQTLTEAARNTEQYQATLAYAANTNFYKARTVNGQTVNNHGTGVFNIVNVKAAITFMRKLRDDVGNPIYLGAKFTLVTGPDLEMEAKQLLGAQNFIFDSNPAAGTPKQRVQTDNYIAPMLDQVTDYWLPVVDPTYGATSWYLFADPAVLAAGEVAFLRGQEEPALYMQAPNAIRISESGAGGALASSMEGSFENDEIAYKMRHCVGAALNVKNWRASYWSDGTGS